MTYTKDSAHPLSKIYERLRKRSYRKHFPPMKLGYYDAHLHHRYYLNGVRDALNAVTVEMKGTRVNATR